MERKEARDPEEDLIITKSLPECRQSVLDLCNEIIRALSRDTTVSEEFEKDEEPEKSKKSGVESWLSAVTPHSSTSHQSVMKLSLEVAGCLVKKVNVDVRFPSRKGFITQLAIDPTPGWVLEQAIVTRKQSELACKALESTFDLTFENDDDMIKLCERLDATLTSLSFARNALLFPNPLGFPRALRPFNGFSPTLGPDFLLDFSIFRYDVVTSAFRVTHVPPQQQQMYQAIVPDPWFDDPTPPNPSRLVGMSILFEGGVTVKVLEHHSISFEVAMLKKIIVFLEDSNRVVRDLCMNVVACLSTRPDFFLSSVSRQPQESDEEEEDSITLVQPHLNLNTM